MAKDLIKTSRLETLEIEWRSPDELKPNDYNPNKQNTADYGLLQASMTEDGFTQPIVVLKDGTIVDGEHRWRAAKDIGMDKIPVVVVNMTAEQAKVATLRHNRARGAEDFGLTADVMRDLQKLGALDWAQDSLRLSDADLNLVMQETEQSAVDAIGAAAENFSQAWVPEQPSESSEYNDSRTGSTSLIVASKKTEEAVEKRREAMDNAQTTEEIRTAARSIVFFRISLRYKGDDAKLVQSVLTSEGTGDAGDTLVRVCKRYNDYMAGNAPAKAESGAAAPEQE